MSGLNSLSGLNQVNVDYRPTVSLEVRKNVDANQPQQAQNVAPGNAQSAAFIFAPPLASETPIWYTTRRQRQNVRVTGMRRMSFAYGREKSLPLVYK